MRLKLTKSSANSKTDLCQFIRKDGSVDELNLPRQGILPHDLVHFVVESKLKSPLALQHGFLSLVARGASASFVMELAHLGDVNKIEEAAIQVEAIVEALQTQLWNGSYEHEYFIYGIQTAAQSRQTPCPELPDAILGKQLFDTAVALNLEWQQLAPCAVMELQFPE
jgi:hypothetical protein